MSDETFSSVIQRAIEHGDTPAVIASDGTFSYARLLDSSARIASALLDGAPDSNDARVAFLVPPSFAYVATLFGIWRAGGIAVPLCVSHPAPELSHVLSDCGASSVIAHETFETLLAPVAQAHGMRLLKCDEALAHAPTQLPNVEPDRPALLIYTSGTTGKPKGALTTHGILSAQITSVVDAWEINPRDRILHVLPLHHLHGILNALLAPLYAGACCEIRPRFDANDVWSRLSSSHDLTLFMAVPTIYSKLAEAWDLADEAQRNAWSDGARRLRLMVSGSAALPASMLERWRKITSHVLLERYGMTEIGMGLGNPLHEERIAGSVGTPFPRMQARLVDEAGHLLADGAPGELEVRGPNVFKEYWNKPEATAAVFTRDGWFKTGDVAVREHGRYRLLGRSSVDILKTGGFKVSALEIEETLREHPAIAEVCVIGIEDEAWGQRVAAVVVLRPGLALDLAELRAWGKDRLASYKVPSLLRSVSELPRNAMGKVQKPEVRKLWDRL